MPPNEPTPPARAGADAGVESARTGQKSPRGPRSPGPHCWADAKCPNCVRPPGVTSPHRGVFSQNTDFAAFGFNLWSRPYARTRATRERAMQSTPLNTDHQNNAIVALLLFAVATGACGDDGNLEATGQGTVESPYLIEHAAVLCTLDREYDGSIVEFSGPVDRGELACRRFECGLPESCRDCCVDCAAGFEIRCPDGRDVSLVADEPMMQQRAAPYECGGVQTPLAFRYLPLGVSGPECDLVDLPASPTTFEFVRGTFEWRSPNGPTGSVLHVYGIRAAGTEYPQQ